MEFSIYRIKIFIGRKSFQWPIFSAQSTLSPSMENTTSHQIFNHKTWRKKVFLKLLRKKSERKRLFQSSYFFEQILKESPIEKVELQKLLSEIPQIQLENFISRNGNVSPYELMCITSVIKDRKPKTLLEIGTFDGNTTLQMALNAPADALIHTLDLPPGASETKQPVLTSDVQFIKDEAKCSRKFENTHVASKIKQHFGDSTNYDFSQFTIDGPLDFIFIDGGHSYECVKSDTENALNVLAEGGVIFWHDFCPLFGGVYQFLCELSNELPLRHIEGTNLVFYSAATRNC